MFGMIHGFPKIRTGWLYQYPQMTVSDFIHGTPKVWNVGMLQQFVDREDILFTRILGIN